MSRISSSVKKISGDVDPHLLTLPCFMLPFSHKRDFVEVLAHENFEQSLPALSSFFPRLMDGFGDLERTICFPVANPSKALSRRSIPGEPNTP